MTHIVVDPVTRIEGHLRIEAEVDGGKVNDAWSSSTMFRGIEIILKGRDPRDAWVFAQRICGVCTTVHAIASIRAVEHAIGAVPPPNARLLRNLIIAAQCVQDHVIHFYHLHALDWVDITSALKADPAKTATLAQSISDWPLSSAKYFSGVRERISTFVQRGQLGPFANAYWGHPAYRLPPEANLMAVAHYLEALDWQRRFIKIHALLGGKNPHLQSFLVGGMATPVDPDSQNALNIDTISALDKLIAEGRDFVTRVYLPDVLAIASFYKDWASIGAGVGNYMVYGDYPEDDSENPELFMPSGIIRARDISKAEPVDQERSPSRWLIPGTNIQAATARRFIRSRGKPIRITPDRSRRTSDWMFAKSTAGSNHRATRAEPMEVGPFARMLVAYVSGRPAQVKQLVDKALATLGRWTTSAVLDFGPSGGAGHRDPGRGRKDGRLGKRAGREHGAP